MKVTVQFLFFWLAGMKYQSFLTWWNQTIFLETLVNSWFFLCMVLCLLSTSVKFLTDHQMAWGKWYYLYFTLYFSWHVCILGMVSLSLQNIIFMLLRKFFQLKLLKMNWWWIWGTFGNANDLDQTSFTKREFLMLNFLSFFTFQKHHKTCIWKFWIFYNELQFFLCLWLSLGESLFWSIILVHELLHIVLYYRYISLYRPLESTAWNIQICNLTVFAK